jgi:hypothetical protein
MFVRTRFSYYAEDVKPYDPKSTFRGGRACEDLGFRALLFPLCPRSSISRCGFLPFPFSGSPIAYYVRFKPQQPHSITMPGSGAQTRGITARAENLWFFQCRIISALRRTTPPN